MEAAKVCQTCQKKGPTLVCGSCQCDLCKRCAQFIPEDQFAFLPSKDEVLNHQTYCDVCNNQYVIPAIQAYEENLSKAKSILVFGDDQGKETRFIRRTEKPVKAIDCVDYNETIMRLAFQAVLSGFNAIIDVSIKPKKTKIGSYQTTLYTGSAIPANVESKRLMKDRSFSTDPN